MSLTLPELAPAVLMVKQEFARALEAILACVVLPNPPPHPPPYPPIKIALALSGGLDSTVLLHLAAEWAAAQGVQLFAFHVHHGLSPNADQWQAHCETQCKALDIPFDVTRVQIRSDSKNGIEEAARLQRYAALGALCTRHGAQLLLTAHHQDDQAETVFLQLLRGSGVAGLSGMDRVNQAPKLLGSATLFMGRPLLDLARKDLEAATQAGGWVHIEDESNHDPRFARNALRHEIMPLIAAHFPGFSQRFARTAQHAQSAQSLLVSLAAQDFASCVQDSCLDLARLRHFDTPRIDNLLRYWFGLRQIRMPSTAWLAELRSQLLDAKPDAQICVIHADCVLRRHHDLVHMTARDGVDPTEIEPEHFIWQGEAERHFPHFGGRLCFIAADEGLDVTWLQAQKLQIRYRSGGERLKLALNRPTRSVKHHCQALDIPPWERETLIVIATAKQALYVSRLGLDRHHFATEPGARVVLEWKPD